MPPDVDRSSERRRWLGRLAAVLVAACTTSVPAQTSLALSSLTVPDKNLPSGCRLRPHVPATTRVAQAGGTTTIVSNPRASWPFPDNPWQGSDRAADRSATAHGRATSSPGRASTDRD